jgi:hypothetical protein
VDGLPCGDGPRIRPRERGRQARGGGEGRAWANVGPAGEEGIFFFSFLSLFFFLLINFFLYTNI